MLCIVIMGKRTFSFFLHHLTSSLSSFSTVSRRKQFASYFCSNTNMLMLLVYLGFYFFALSLDLACSAAKRLAGSGATTQAKHAFRVEKRQSARRWHQ